MANPKTYTSIEDLRYEIDMYFANSDTPTLGGLSMFLGINYNTFLRYGSEGHEFKDAIDEARIRSESFIEAGALRGDLNATFSIFALKNRFGWKDKHEIETKLSGTLSLTALLQAAEDRERLQITTLDKSAAIEAQPA
jgi:hypothetical protein